MNKEVHIMLDLETMWVTPSTAIIGIGLVAFTATDDGDPYILEELEVAVDLSSSVAHGGVIDPSTVIWWMQPELEQGRPT